MYKTVEELASALSARLGLEVKIEPRGTDQHRLAVMSPTGLCLLSVEAWLHTTDGWLCGGWGGESDMSNIIWGINHPDQVEFAKQF